MSGKNDSNIAVILSFFHSGLGQLYNGEIRKGLLLMLGPLSFALLFFGLAHLYKNEEDIFYIIAGLFFVIHLIGWGYSIDDAFNPPQSLNSKQWMALEENRKRNELSITGKKEDSPLTDFKPLDPIPGRVCPYCHAEVSEKSTPCPKCGKLFRD